MRIEVPKGPPIHHSRAITADETAFRIHYCGRARFRWSLIALGYMLVIVAAAEPTDVKA